MYKLCPGLNAVTKITKIAKFCKPSTKFDEDMQITAEEDPRRNYENCESYENYKILQDSLEKSKRGFKQSFKRSLNESTKIAKTAKIYENYENYKILQACLQKLMWKCK